MRRISFQIVLAVFYTAFCSSALAGPIDRLVGCITRKIEKPVSYFFVKTEKTSLTLHDAIRDKNISIELGDRLGAGFFGSAIEVKSVSDSLLATEIKNYRGKVFDGPVVLKLPHALKFRPQKSLGTAIKESRKELAIQQELEFHLEEIEVDSNYPSNPAWNKGVAPVVPIFSYLDTPRGILFFKPKVTGLTLKELNKIAKQNGGKLPLKYMRGLRDYYQFVQAVQSRMRPPNLPPINPDSWLGRLFKITPGFSPDIRPPNLVWIEDPNLLNALGYNRPGFISYELSQVPFNHGHYIKNIGMALKDYLREFMLYMKKAK